MLAPDKQKHFWAGLAVAILAGPLVYPLAYLIVLFLWPGIAAFLTIPLTGAITAAVAGAVKEIIWDWLLKKCTPEFLDFLATAIGGIVGCLVLKLFC